MPLILKHFLPEMCPDTEIKDISELIEAELNITAANGEAIHPLCRLDSVKFPVMSRTTSLTFSSYLETSNLPLIGYNVIEHYVIEKTILYSL